MSRSQFLAAALPLIALAACADGRDPSAVVAPPSANYESLRGAQLARDVCGQCHGELGGATLGTAVHPALGCVRTYTLDEFGRLLALGVTRDGREVDSRMHMTQGLHEADYAALLEYLTQHVASAP